MSGWQAISWLLVGAIPPPLQDQPAQPLRDRRLRGEGQTLLAFTGALHDLHRSHLPRLIILLGGLTSRVHDGNNIWSLTPAPCHLPMPDRTSTSAATCCASGVSPTTASRWTPPVSGRQLVWLGRADRLHCWRANAAVFTPPCNLAAFHCLSPLAQSPPCLASRRPQREQRHLAQRHCAGGAAGHRATRGRVRRQVQPATVAKSWEEPPCAHCESCTFVPSTPQSPRPLIALSVLALC